MTHLHKTFECTDCVNLPDAERLKLPNTLRVTSSSEFATRHEEATGHNVVMTRWTPIGKSV